MNADPLQLDYQRDGVVVIPSLLSKAEVAEIRAQLKRYGAEQLPRLPSGDFTLEPDGRTIRNLWRLEQHSEFFRQFAGQPRLIELVRPLLNGDPLLIGVETFNKPAKVGSRTPPHQDNAYFCQSPPDVLTVWIALDHSTAENGAVEYLLGSHRELLPHQPSGVKGNSFGLAHLPPDGEFPVFLGAISAGDALIHHCQTVHFGATNESDRPRLSLVIVYRAAHTTTDPALRDSYERARALTPQNA